MDEQVYHVDWEDNVLGSISKDEMVRRVLNHRVSRTLVINQMGKILVHRRSDEKEIFGGNYAMFVSGTVRYGESYTGAAVRELEEEIGVKQIVALEYLFKQGFQHSEHNCINTIFRTMYGGPIVMQPEEVEDAHYVTPAELEDLIKLKEFAPDDLTLYQQLQNGPGKA